MAMDVVFVVGPQKDGSELRHALRSLEAHLPHERVWVAGYKPRWLRNVGHIARSQFSSKWANSTTNLRAACAHPGVSSEFVYMNDDFFIMEPIAEVPALHRGPVAEVAARTPEGKYRRGMLATARALRSLGVDDPLSYELHLPMVVDKALMLEALALPEAQGISVLHKRTLYGNLAGGDGEQAPDVKTHTADEPPPPGPFVSTSAASWVGRTGAAVRDTFPEPCRYEEAL